MKILSWNIYKHNKSVEKALSFLGESKADIICLQEFPPEELEKLEALGFHLTLGEEVIVYSNGSKKTDRLHMVIASRLPVEGNGIIKHHEAYVDKKTKRYESFSVDTLYVDVEMENRKVRIFNVHLKCVAGPYYRLNQFQHITDHIAPDRENIICGDFNTFGYPVLNLFLWRYFGYQRGEVLTTEKKVFAAFFDVHNLQNPFKGYMTFLKFPVQLDYILLPRSTKILEKERYRSAYGSDHLPISIKI
jgi:endonuclease/exonuclease/phosphatase family metal-dependent hydrolase